VVGRNHLGLDKAADYYYYPGFHEPGTANTLGITKTLWDRLTTSEQALIEAAAHAEVTRSLGQFNAENVKWLKVLRADKRIKILRFSDELIRVFGNLSKEVLADTAAKDPLTRKVHDSYMSLASWIGTSSRKLDTVKPGGLRWSRLQCTSPVMGHKADVSSELAHVRFEGEADLA
jgi:TRAP-type mannitol/chloroaromatic compound transport system substrate-binding protein